jgi:hypothetical protein
MLDIIGGLAPFIIVGLIFCAWFLSYRIEHQKAIALRGCEMHLGNIVCGVYEVKRQIVTVADELAKDDKL